MMVYTYIYICTYTNTVHHIPCSIHLSVQNRKTRHPIPSKTAEGCCTIPLMDDDHSLYIR